jgi:hypothetical protein
MLNEEPRPTIKLRPVRPVVANPVVKEWDNGIMDTMAYVLRVFSDGVSAR